MSALLLKDYYVIFRQMKIFLLLILVFSCIPGTFYSTFAVVYASMLPYTALAYDERSRWDQMAAMMPYSARDVVLSKYLFGWIAVAVSAAATFVLQTILSVIWLSDVEGPSIPVILLSVCVAVCILDITLPMMFRFGVEKGRLAMFLIIFLVCASAGGIATIEQSSLDGGFYLSLSLVPAAIAAVVLSVVSIPLAIRFLRPPEPVSGMEDTPKTLRRAGPGGPGRVAGPVRGGPPKPKGAEMKNSHTCPKCGSRDIVRIPDHPSRYASGSNILHHPVHPAGQGPGDPLRLLRLRVCGELGGVPHGAGPDPPDLRGSMTLPKAGRGVSAPGLCRNPQKTSWNRPADSAGFAI